MIDDDEKTISHNDNFIDKHIKNRIVLHDWQQRAIRYFFKNNKAIFECPTGVGKTQLAIEIINKIWKEKDVRVLVVVPKNVILETGWYKELYNNGISIKDIGVFYRSIKEIGKITLTNIQNVCNIPLEMFDVIVADECHNFGSDRLLEVLKHDFMYKIGLSATVNRMDGKHIDIIGCFDYNMFKYSPKQALKEGILNAFDFFNIGVDLDEDTTKEYDELTQQINTMIRVGGSYSRIMSSNTPLKFSLISKMSERTKLVNNYHVKFDVVKAICNIHKEDKIIIFNQYNEQTSNLYWHLLDVGIKTLVVHTGIKKEIRDEALEKFRKDEVNVMLCSRMLDEGYNIPKTDVAVLMANNSTKRQVIQRIGRVLRKKKNKSFIYEIFCRDTIEEQYNKERSLFFEELASNHKNVLYQGDKKLQETIC